MSNFLMNKNKHNHDRSPTAEEESRIEQDYLNSTRGDQKSKLLERLAKSKEKNTKTVYKNEFKRLAFHINKDSNAYQKDVKTYRDVMSELERTEQMFIQKFKRGQGEVYNSI